ncbi:MAG: DUF3971 domain-containing protein, partial [Halomonas sp.]|nr:DUF3971 domain-containing protein [Halomonas sp.]
MTASRAVLRWGLTLLAVGLACVALLLGGLRLALYQADGLRDVLGAQLTRQFNATLRLGHLETAIRGFDPALALRDLTLTSQAGVDPFPLLGIERASLRLDTLASLRSGYPIFDAARVEGVTLHLYQDRHGRWAWPGPAELPPEIVPDGAFAMHDIDQVTALLLRQDLVGTDLRLVLHGIDRRVTLVAPRLVMVGDEHGAHLEGRVLVEGERDHALTAVLEMSPGADGLSDYSATLQLDADLGVLSRLGRLMTRPAAMRLDAVDGEARLWADWRQGRLSEARAVLDIATLSLASADEASTLDGLHGAVAWQRGKGDDWQAWADLEGLASGDVDIRALPARLQARGSGAQWRLRSTPFELAGLASLASRLPLPQGVEQALDELAPRGRVAGLEVGWWDEAWQGRALVEDLAVSAWQDIPGGGPFDAWIAIHDRQGSVRFTGGEAMTLDFPEIFAAPMALDGAAGVVEWSLDEIPVIRGENLVALWRGATVNGGFRLAMPGTQPGEFELQLDMTDIDAVKTPLIDWLPARILDPELRDWLAGGVAGRVPEGSLLVQMPLHESQADEADGRDAVDADRPFEGQLRLSLQIEDGRLPYDPQWPALEEVSGTLTLRDEQLQAHVDHAQTLGLVSENAEVVLKDEQLTVQAPLRGTSQALLDFLAASPVDGLETFSTWRSEGEVAGTLALRVPMTDEAPSKDETAFEAEVEASIEAPTVT